LYFYNITIISNLKSFKTLTMKIYVIVGSFFQLRGFEPELKACSGTWGTKCGPNQELFSKFLGLISLNEDGSSTSSEVIDVYGKASITNFLHKVEAGVETITFKKSYVGLMGVINYEFKKRGDIFVGYFQSEANAAEDNGWAKCMLIPVDESLFYPDEFIEEMKIQVAKVAT